MHPFFRGHEHAINEAFVPTNFLSVIQVVQKSTPEVEQRAGFRPAAQTTMHGAF
jgi:hypothetical protein